MCKLTIQMYILICKWRFILAPEFGHSCMSTFMIPVPSLYNLNPYTSKDQVYLFLTNPDSFGCGDNSSRCRSASTLFKYVFLIWWTPLPRIILTRIGWQSIIAFKRIDVSIHQNINRIPAYSYILNDWNKLWNAIFAALANQLRNPKWKNLWQKTLKRPDSDFPVNYPDGTFCLNGSRIDLAW